MRLPRLTTRRLMVLVAVVALTLGAYARLSALRLAYGAKVDEHERAAGQVFFEKVGSAQWRCLKLQYHMDLAHKYERAARYPWLPVPPDPPPPK